MTVLTRMLLSLNYSDFEIRVGLFHGYYVYNGVSLTRVCSSKRDVFGVEYMMFRC